jgi:AcrR family transcriptional regulator
VTRRSYTSPRREQAAEQTRAAILDAAERLFRGRGYGAATLSGVASEAGVSLATVKVAYGTKRGLLEAVVRARLLDDASGRPLNQREPWQQMLAEPDPTRLIDRLVDLSAQLHERSAELIEAVTRAAATDPELVEIARRGAERRHADMQDVIVALETRSALRDGLSADRAADELWALASPSLYLQLTVERGWSPGEWAAFVADALKAALLGPAAG